MKPSIVLSVLPGGGRTHSITGLQAVVSATRARARTNTHANAHAFSEELEAKAKTRPVGGTAENSAMICTALVSESHCGNEPRWPWSNYI